MSDLGLLKERGKYKKLCREAEALYVAIQISTTESKKVTQRAITQTNNLKKSELRQRIHALAGCRKTLVFSCSLGEIATIS